MAQFVTHIQPTLMEASQGHVPHHHHHQVGMQHTSHLPHSGHNLPSPPTAHHNQAAAALSGHKSHHQRKPGRNYHYAEQQHHYPHHYPHDHHKHHPYQHGGRPQQVKFAAQIDQFIRLHSFFLSLTENHFFVDIVVGIQSFDWIFYSHLSPDSVQYILPFRVIFLFLWPSLTLDWDRCQSVWWRADGCPGERTGGRTERRWGQSRCIWIGNSVGRIHRLSSLAFFIFCSDEDEPNMKLIFFCHGLTATRQKTEKPKLYNSALYTYVGFYWMAVLQK